MRVIAKRGDHCYLLVAEDDPERLQQDRRPAARVLDLVDGTLDAPRNLYSILARGYWDDVKMSEEELRGLLSQIRRVHGPAIDEPWTLPTRARDMEPEPLSQAA